MPECSGIAGCPFFNDKMKDKPAIANSYKRNYCKGDFKSCARYMVSKNLGKAAVPADMFPNQKERAEKLIKHAA